MMAIATKTEEVTEVVVVTPETYTLELTKEEAEQLVTLLGAGVAETYAPENRPIMSIYQALRKAMPNFFGYEHYKYEGINGERLGAYVIKKRN